MGQLPQVIFSISDGNLGRTALNNDEISGLVFYNANVADLTGITAAANVVKFTNLGSIETAGITETSTNFKNEWYVINEYFRMGGGDVWIGIFPTNTGNTFTELTTMKNVSAGEIRQYGVFANALAFNSTHVNTINTLIATMYTEKKPAVAIAAFHYTGVTSLSNFTDLRNLAADAPYVSVVIGTDTANLPSTSATTSLPNLGAVVGALSSAKVSTNILYVSQFNYTDGVNMVTPGIRYNGTTITPITSIAESDLDSLNDKGYIFWHYQANINGTYLSNDNNSTDITSDFSSIHNNRVIGKVIREVDANVTPLIGSPVNLSGGLLTPQSVNIFQTAASSPLNIMESNGEISSYSIYIDKTQKVSTNNTISIQISIVPIFSADNITITIGFSTT
jgi:hypothetical protein